MLMSADLGLTPVHGSTNQFGLAWRRPSHDSPAAHVACHATTPVHGSADGHQASPCADDIVADAPSDASMLSGLAQALYPHRHVLGYAAVAAVAMLVGMAAGSSSGGVAAPKRKRR